MFHKVTSVASLTVLSEFNVSLWASDLGGRPHKTVNNVTACLSRLHKLRSVAFCHRSGSQISFGWSYLTPLLLLLMMGLNRNTKEIKERRSAFCLHRYTKWYPPPPHMVKFVMANCRTHSKWNRRSSIMSKPLVITLRFCLQDEIHQSKVYGTVKNELWKIFILRCYFVIIVFFVRETHQQQLMQSVNFSYPCCIGNTSAPLHLLLRSWLLKVDSKHRLCWLSACLHIRTQIVGRLTACCCQSNKSYPLWPHLLVNAVELWTVMSFIWAVCHRHFLSQVPLLRRPPSVPTLYVFSFPIKRKSYPETPCFPS